MSILDDTVVFERQSPDWGDHCRIIPQSGQPCGQPSVTSVPIAIMVPLEAVIPSQARWMGVDNGRPFVRCPICQEHLEQMKFAMITGMANHWRFDWPKA